ncbi:hypothetical protein [Desulfosarcina cetonica]|uniref:hypothetical protein n=1 Tax=Desulfosarcina cetonica TaxID=90730 RepID=UPI00155DBA1E|nr:hypothetical protein [Desulfosarcina cetonica]
MNKATNVSESHALGPMPVNGEPALFEVRNFDDYLWYHPDRLGTWYSWRTNPTRANTCCDSKCSTKMG